MRKTVTALFSDIADSTPLARRSIPSRFETVCPGTSKPSRPFSSGTGTVEKFIGEAVMAVSGPAHADVRFDFGFALRRHALSHSFMSDGRAAAGGRPDERDHG